MKISTQLRTVSDLRQLEPGQFAYLYRSGEMKALAMMFGDDANSKHIIVMDEDSYPPHAIDSNILDFFSGAIIANDLYALPDLSESFTSQKREPYPGDMVYCGEDFGFYVGIDVDKPQSVCGPAISLLTGRLISTKHPSVIVPNWKIVMKHHDNAITQIWSHSSEHQ